MGEILCFFAGYIISGAISVLLMGMMQLGKLKEYDELLKNALLAGRKSEDSGEDHNKDNK